MEQPRLKGMADSPVPKRTRWCLTCKRKKLLWNVKVRTFICQNCNVYIRADKYCELTQDTALRKSKRMYQRQVELYARVPTLRELEAMNGRF